MEIQRAFEITGQCVRNRMAFIMGDDYVPLPDCSLAEMLEANELVSKDNEGKGSFHMVVDPRGIAASYAFEHYGRDPHELLEAVGFQLNTAET